MTTMKLTEDMKLMFTVLLASHPDQIHTYSFPAGTTSESILDTLNEVFQAFWDLAAGKCSMAVINHPTTSYTSAHFIGLRTEFVGEKELVTALEERSRRLGFVRN